MNPLTSILWPFRSLIHTRWQRPCTEGDLEHKSKGFRRLAGCGPRDMRWHLTSSHGTLDGDLSRLWRSRDESNYSVEARQGEIREIVRFAPFNKANLLGTSPSIQHVFELRSPKESGTLRL
jgi:hypothetical protein